MTPETSLGFEVIDFARNVLEVDLLPWQEWLFIHGLELNATGDAYRFRTVLVLVARQNGKTTALAVLTLWRLLMDGAKLILGTSTNLDYAKIAWQKVVNFAWGPPGAKAFQGSAPELEGEFFKPRYQNGSESLTSVENGVYRIGTADRRGGRSLSVDLLILDELREHKAWDAWSASSKTTNARARGQRWALSNMGDDTSVVLNHLQNQALEYVRSGEGDDSLAIFEWSAPDGCDPGDRSVWPLANPALGYTILEDTLASDFATDPPNTFLTEVLCRRVPSLDAPPIDPEAWADLATAVPVSGTPVFFLDCSPNLQSASIAGVVTAWGGNPHVKLAAHRPGVAWVIPRIAELVKKYPGAKWSYESTGPASAFAEQLSGVGVQVEEPLTITDMARGCAHLQRLVEDGAMSHSGDEAVTVALTSAVRRDIGDPGLWSWGRRKSAGDISPLVAVTGALWLLESSPPTPFFGTYR